MKRHVEYLIFDDNNLFLKKTNELMMQNHVFEWKIVYVTCCFNFYWKGKFAKHGIQFIFIIWNKSHILAFLCVKLCHEDNQWFFIGEIPSSVT